MSEALYFILFTLGLLMIIKGSDWFIDSVIWIATVFKIPYIIIGATIVSICTTMPETFVSLTASIKGETDMAFGNAIGSIALNTGLIMAIIIFFARPTIDNVAAFVRNGAFLIIVVAFIWFLGATTGEISRPIGILLLLLLAIYIGTNYFQAKIMMAAGVEYDVEDDDEIDHSAEFIDGASFDSLEKEIDISRKVFAKKITAFAIGISMVILGSGLLVDNGIKIAELLGVPSIVIAVTFTALGTSLPELVTAISSIRKQVTNLGVGNIIGADILNIIQVVGISATVNPIPLDSDPSILPVQLPLTLVIVLMAIAFGIAGRGGFRRWQGSALFVVYSIFLVLNLFREGTPFLGPLIFN